MHSRVISNSPFQRLDDDVNAEYNNKEAVHVRHEFTVTVNSTEYESSGDGYSVQDSTSQRTRTVSHGQEQYGKGFV